MIEAGIYECDDFEPHPTFEKFAELIVRECLTIADKEHKLALEFEWDNDDTAQTIKDGIKKHFGVEQ
jgi:hypothetical protein